MSELCRPLGSCQGAVGQRLRRSIGLRLDVGLLRNPRLAEWLGLRLLRVGRAERLWLLRLSWAE